MAIAIDKLIVANRILPLLLRTASFSIEKNRLVLSWESSSGKIVKRFWSTPKGSFFPVFSEKMSCGGTHTTAITQLANWVRGKPVLPLETWEYWFGDAVRMRGKAEILPLLVSAGYPPKRRCEWCGKAEGRMDWWTIGRKSGLGCWGGCSELNARRKPNRG